MTLPGGRAAALLSALLLAAAPLAAQGLSGSARVEGFWYPQRAVESDPWVVGWATLLLKEEGKAGPVSFAAVARAEEISSAERGPLVLDLADRELRRSPLSLREAWARVPLGAGLDLEAGRFLLGWGKTDGYSPSDAFLPRDLSDPFADEKLPLWAVRVRGQRGPLRLDALATLVTTPWRLPVLGGRFAPVDTGAAPFPVVLADGANEPPRTGFGAVRLLGAAGDWDFGAWGRAGVRPAPLLVPRPDLARPGPDGVVLPLDRRWAREEGLGLEVSRVVGSWVARGEAAALFSSDPWLGDALIWTVSAERAFGDGNLVVTFAANARATPIDPALLFDRAYLPGIVLIWSRGERWGSWRLVSIQGLRHGDGLAKAEVTDALSDALSLTLGAELPYGSRYGPFGARPEARRLRLAATWAW